MAKHTETIEIPAGHYAPLKTRDYVLIGPGALRVTRSDNGHVDVEITEGKSSPVRDAIRQKLQRISY